MEEGKKMKTFKRKGYAVLLVLCALMLFCVPVQAAKKYKKQWQTVNGRCCYYNAKGKKVTGLKKINKKWYYFDSSGVQHTGWQKVGGDYYFFTIDKAQKGSMVKGKTINGVYLYVASGKARIVGDIKEKLDLMVEAGRTVEKITDWTMTRTTRLRTCFNYCRTAYRECSWRKFSSAANWDRLYAGDMFYRGGGDCFAYAAAFAYMANAVGYEAYVISSGGHGWAEINGRVFDPEWSRHSKVDIYFSMSYDLSGVSGRPRYKGNRRYVVKI